MSSVSTSSTVRAVLSRKPAEPTPTPGVVSNPDFIAEDDHAGESRSRAMREAARFTAFAGQLVKGLPPADVTQATVTVPKLVLVGHAWETRSFVISGHVTLKALRPSKFKGAADVSEPSRQLAAFMQGQGHAWESFRDDDMPGLLLAWANSVNPSPHEALYASQSLAVAMAARAGLAVSSLSHAFLNPEEAPSDD
jgi:hypothetical protein